MTRAAFLCVDKPEGVSSFAAVKKARKIFSEKSAGHCGTLDPAASGLLVIAIGKATRLIPDLGLEPKKYLFGLQFGSTTDTLDREGTVVESGLPIPSAETILSCIPQFTGIVKQRPPIYSAVKIEGRRAYDRARSGETFETKEREITVFSLELISFDPEKGVGDFSVTCSGGTYVRSLCRQIAEAAGSTGYASYIRRVSIGSFSLDLAVSLDAEPSLWHSALVEPAEALPYPAVEIDEQALKSLSFGGHFSAPCGINYAVITAVYDGVTVAIAKKQGENCYQPVKVLVSSGDFQ